MGSQQRRRSSHKQSLPPPSKGRAGSRLRLLLLRIVLLLVFALCLTLAASRLLPAKSLENVLQLWGQWNPPRGLSQEDDGGPRLAAESADPAASFCSQAWKAAAAAFLGNGTKLENQDSGSGSRLEESIAAVCSGKAVSRIVGELVAGDDDSSASGHGQLLPENNCTLSTHEASCPMANTTGSTGPKFLLIVSLPEQLSKAKQHFAEVVYLAKMFNRTLILPRVGSSHIGYQQLLPFCAYFDVDALCKVVPWVTEDCFATNILKEHPGLSSSYLCLLRPDDGSCLDYLKQASPLFVSVLAITRSIPTSSNSFHVFGGYHSRFESQDAKQLQDEESSLLELFQREASTDILAFSRSSWFPAVSRSRWEAMHLGLQFAPHLRSQARELAAKLGHSFVAIHLRLEFMVHQLRKFHPIGPELREGMMRCAGAAVKFARRHLRSLNSSHVFLAADVGFGVPVDDGGSEKAARQVAVRTDSMGILADAEKKLVTSYMTESVLHVWKSLSSVVWDDEDPTFHTLDGGVQGILDKLMCAHANVFLMGAKACGGGQSFDLDIYEMRKLMRKRLSSNDRFQP